MVISPQSVKQPSSKNDDEDTFETKQGVLIPSQGTHFQATLWYSLDPHKSSHVAFHWRSLKGQYGSSCDIVPEMGLNGCGWEQGSQIRRPRSSGSHGMSRTGHVKKKNAGSFSGRGPLWWSTGAHHAQRSPTKRQMKDQKVTRISAGSLLKRDVLDQGPRMTAACSAMMPPPRKITL
jgi:hypothetical protein